MSKQKLELTWVGKDTRPRQSPAYYYPMGSVKLLAVSIEHKVIT